MNHETYEIPAEVAESIMAQAEPKAGKAAKSRATVMANVLAALAEGHIPGLQIGGTNASYQKHADAIEALAHEGDIAGLNAYALGGCNTYSKRLRAYRDALVAHLQAPKAKAPKAKAPKAKAPKANAPKAKAPKAKAPKGAA